MRLIIFLSLAFLSACTPKQEECNCQELQELDSILYNAKKEKYTGTCIDTNENGFIALEKRILEGIVDYEKVVHFYFDSITIGSQTEKFKNGKITDKLWFENGQLFVIKNWKDTIRNGVNKVWLSNGQKWFEGTYKNGERDGVYKGWHPNGNLKVQGQYSNGKPNSLWEYWREDGSLLCKTNFNNGKIINQNTFPIIKSDSLFIEHYPSGKINWVKQYRDGLLHQTSTKYYKNGVKSSETTYREGKQDGHFIMWKIDSRDFQIKFLGQGDTVFYQKYDNGKLISNN